jgi:hypothetical protein
MHAVHLPFHHKFLVLVVSRPKDNGWVTHQTADLILDFLFDILQERAVRGI